MKLYLARHGEAVPEHEDPERPLTRRGKATIQRLALFLGTSGLEVEHVFHSGKRRAAETAEILARSVSATLRVEPIEGLEPEAPVGPLVRRIDRWESDTLVVSHLPLIGHTIATLTRCGTTSPPWAIDPGTITCLFRPDGHAGAPWVLEWLLPTSLLGIPDIAF
jgi:phosphohistidine phosphatase